jgi:alpha-beta hydrolase superfamily lysophospholipase
MGWYPRLMQVPFYFSTRTAARLTAAAVLVVTSAAVRAQQAPAVPAPGESTLIVFLQGREVGREQVSLARTPSGWTITASGALGAPFNQGTKRFEVTYAPDWQPIELKIDATVQSRPIGLATSFGTTTAINEITNNGVTSTKTDQITARAVVIPSNFFAAYEALAARLSSMTPGGEVPVYVAPQAEIKLTVRAVTPATYQTPAGALNTRRFTVSLQNPTGPLDAEITVDERGRFAKLEIHAAGLSVARLDVAGVATRQQTVRNPTDVDVKIPAAGFGLAGTITTPAAQGRLRHPAVVLVAGSGPIERDAMVAGIPLFAQLAAQLSDRDFVVLRYDKRGTGQSGGRTERVTLQDYADDVAAVVKWLAKRKDVDPERIFVVGHSEGASIGMLAAAAENKIEGLVLMAGMAIPGRDLILEQQQHVLGASNLPDAERAEKIALQKQILEAAMTEKGWESLPEDVRGLVDTPWYRSLLAFDPAKTMTRVKQPILILQGDRDVQVKPYHADRLAELGRARKKSGSTEVKHFPTLNHLLVPAQTGEVSEYATLQTRTISPEVAGAIASWVASVPR